MTEKLLPCPFCDGEAEITQHGTTRMSTHYECIECGLQLESGETFNHGARWNTRTPDPRLQVAIEALEGIIQNATLLHQNSVGCAVNHYGNDCEQFGLPGWLDDAENSIVNAKDALSTLKGGE